MEDLAESEWPGTLRSKRIRRYRHLDPSIARCSSVFPRSGNVSSLFVCLGQMLCERGIEHTIRHFLEAFGASQRSSYTGTYRAKTHICS